MGFTLTARGMWEGRASSRGALVGSPQHGVKVKEGRAQWHAHRILRIVAPVLGTPRRALVADGENRALCAWLARCAICLLVDQGCALAQARGIPTILFLRRPHGSIVLHHLNRQSLDVVRVVRVAQMAHMARGADPLARGVVPLARGVVPLAPCAAAFRDGCAVGHQAA